MADYRCPAHDRIFESYTDSRKPGANATETMAAHPAFRGQVGHPDCPKCQEEIKEGNYTQADRVKVAQDRAAALQAVAAKAVQDAANAARDVQAVVSNVPA